MYYVSAILSIVLRNYKNIIIILFYPFVSYKAN